MTTDADGFELRTHQRRALTGLDAAWRAGRRRCWVVLPPGAGKTLVGLESARLLLAGRQVERVAVLSPNTAIQGQWVRQAETIGLEAGDDRSLSAALTSLTYQSLAVFDPDAETDEDGHGTPLISRLHENGRLLIKQLQEAGPVLLILDECHHLLEVWGRLLAELLDLLPQARVLGLTATPPAALTRGEAALVAELFGPIVFETSIPAVVREGDLAPFAELVWLTEPTPTEQDWLAESAERFAELVTGLSDPAYGSVPFLTWLERRFVQRAGDAPGWEALARSEPALALAALRVHHAGLLALPDGAVIAEEHRRDPTADDWVVLIDDWVKGALLASHDPADAPVLAGIRRALPSVGYVLTKRGVRRGRSPVDRVLARSESKVVAAAQIVYHERLALGDGLRLLVLCDHERASATLPADLDGVLSEQAGSAHAALSALLADVGGSPDAVLVTGTTVAGAPATLAALRDHIAATDAALAARLAVEDGADYGRLVGPWTSRTWVGHVTRFFEAGGCHVLVGTRGLLGEGWDARRITGIVDLTAVTTATAVVQTRGRALRIDPANPAKVAINWSLACVAAGHPRGDNDWQRLVRKHDGYFGVDDDGTVVDGVGHIDAAFSPYLPPPATEFEALNARMLVRAEDRDAIRARWRIGEPYDDAPTRTVRIRPDRPGRLGTAGDPRPVVVREGALEVRSGAPHLRPSRIAATAGWTLTGTAAAGWGVAAAAASPGLAVASTALTGLALVTAVPATVWRGRALRAEGRRRVAAAAEPPSVTQLAGAVADGLHAAGRLPVGADRLRVEVDRSGTYRVRLAEVAEPHAALFASALDEVLAPLASPRYIISRWVVTDRERTGHELARIGATGRIAPDGEVWHAVPSVLAGNAQEAEQFGRAWDHWIGGGAPLYTGSPRGSGVLAAQRGADPLAVTTMIRRQWS
ncbi:DEAD/DEAH box helicase family protein [Nocardioides sp. BP30]|uniref:DEAD/DEAH box helicase family protein n=1 Tax=Nocardioides sp. BP30 TaxID=3036374 RepID=UPI002469A279|nr:DEAD/DEAH box helicase family protein [Nocardioides sp. BP30]WGL50606.1 DEAD/DEAH box helicase family protein [Nocardioides sp. BP30]